MPESWGINFVCMIISSSGQNEVDANLFTTVFQSERRSLGDWAGEAVIQT